MVLEHHWSRKSSYSSSELQFSHIRSNVRRANISNNMQPLIYFTAFFGVTEYLLKEEERRRKFKGRDLLGNLPPEMASAIFRYLLNGTFFINFFENLLVTSNHPPFLFSRYLEVTDLLTMMEVDAKWGVLIESDPILRRRLSRAKATFRKIPKENRDSKARRTLSKMRHLRKSCNHMRIIYFHF